MNGYIMMGLAVFAACLFAFVALVPLHVTGQIPILLSPPLPMICMMPFIVWCFVKGLKL